MCGLIEFLFYAIMAAAAVSMVVLTIAWSAGALVKTIEVTVTVWRKLRVGDRRAWAYTLSALIYFGPLAVIWLFV